MKKILVTALSAAMLVTSVGLTACGNEDEEILSKYTLKETFVDDDFVLPSTISGKEVSWTSSNTDSIEVTKRTDDWLADVKLADDTKTVNLTVKCGKAEKSFEVTIQALDVNYIAGKYNFKYDKSSVYKDFALDSSFVYEGKTASITWTVDNKYTDYINISEDGKTCKVTESTIDQEVKINATFSYNSKTTTVPYRMNVTFERKHLQEVDYWYNNTGVSITMNGYVVAIATEYSSKYGNVSLYMVDEDGCAGYYIYRLKADDENAALLKPGAHITVTNTTNTNYNGLIETNAGGNLVVNKDKSISEEEVAKKVYALDNDLLAAAPATIYNTSRLVSLDKWTVDSVAEEAPAAGETGALFTLKKDKVKVNVSVSKYLEGAYKTKADNATWTALTALQGTIKVGDVVSLKGLLGKKDDTFEIMPFNATDVVKEDAAASTTPAHVNKVKDAISKVAKTMDDNAGYIIVADKEFALPTVEGVEITYTLLQNSEAVTIGENKISIVAGKENKAYIQVNYTATDGTNEYTTSTFHVIHSKSMTDEEVVDRVRFEFDLGVDEIMGSMALDTTVKEFPGATLSWSLKEAVDGITVETDKKGTTLAVKLSETEREVVLVATISYGTAIATKEFTIKVLGVTVAEGTVKFDFGGITDKGTKIPDDATALKVFGGSMFGSAANLTAAKVDTVFQGNATGGAYANTSGLLKLGSGSANGTVTLTFDKNVSKIEIVCHDWYAKSDKFPENTNQLSVNGSEAKFATYNETGEGQPVVFELTPANEVVITTSNTGSTEEKKVGGRIFIFEIIVHFAN